MMVIVKAVWSNSKFTQPGVPEGKQLSLVLQWGYHSAHDTIMKATSSVLEATATEGF